MYFQFSSVQRGTLPLRMIWDRSLFPINTPESFFHVRYSSSAGNVQPPSENPALRVSCSEVARN